MCKRVDENKLRKLYVEERKSYDEIASILGLSRSSIYRWIKKYKLPLQIHNIQELTGKVFGNLTVIEYVSSGRYRYLDIKTGKYTNGGKYDVWKCKCQCGEEFNVQSGNLKKSQGIGCRQCRALNLSDKFKKYPIDYKVWYRMVNRCNKKGLDLDVTPEYLYDLFLSQNGKCALTGIDIYFGNTRNEESTASPDRINPNQGYLKGNIRWVHKIINSMRNSLPDKIFLDWCEKIIYHSKK